MPDAIITVLHAPSHLIHKIILLICYTGSPQATKEEVLRLLQLVQSHRPVGDDAADVNPRLGRRACALRSQLFIALLYCL